MKSTHRGHADSSWENTTKTEKAAVTAGALTGFLVTILMMVLDPPHSVWDITNIFHIVFITFIGAAGTGCALYICDNHSLPRRITLIIGSLLFLIGFGGFMNGFLCASGVNPWTSNTTEMPLGDVSSIAVDDQGRIYLALGFYSRVQQYDVDGRFNRGWFLGTGGGHMTLRIDDEQNLEVYATPTDTVYTYDDRGVLLSQREEANRHAGFMDLEAINAQGMRYEYRGWVLFPRIVQVDAAGRGTTIISMPWHRWLWMGPLPAWGIFAIGLVTLGLAQSNKKT